MTVSRKRDNGREGRAAGLLTLGGLAAAFGVASCCALPMLFTISGISAAWLFGIASFAAPYRNALLVIGAVCLLGGAAALWQQQRKVSCGLCATPSRSGRALTVIGLFAGLVLLLAGYLYV